MTTARQTCACKRSGRDHYRRRCPVCGLATQFAPGRRFSQVRWLAGLTNWPGRDPGPQLAEDLDELLIQADSAWIMPTIREPRELRAIPESVQARLPEYRAWREKASQWHACTVADMMRRQKDIAQRARVLCQHLNRRHRRLIAPVLARWLPGLAQKPDNGFWNPWREWAKSK